MTAIGNNSYLSIALVLTLCAGSYWLGGLAREVRGLSATQQEHARLIAEASTTLAAVQARLEERK